MNLFLKFLVIVLVAVEAQAGPTLTDFWNGKAVWVMETNRVGVDFHFHFISVLPIKQELYGYYINGYTAADGASKMGIGRARSRDGLDWTNDGRVIDAGTAASWDERMAGFPGAWKDGDTWYLVYEGAGGSPGDIGLATSKDGLHFVKDARNPILRHHPTDWERANIGTPSLYKERGVWYLFYHGYDGNVCQIGVASGTSLTNLTRAPANPIIPVSAEATAWDSGTIGRRSRIVKEGGYYYLAFEGSGPQPYATTKWSSGMARSKSLTSGWEKFPGNQMITQTPGGMGYDGPELLRLNGTWYLYVRMPESVVSGRFRLEAKKGI